MRLAASIQIFGGGPGSGCNPEVANPRCGRPSSGDNKNSGWHNMSDPGRAQQVLKGMLNKAWKPDTYSPRPGVEMERQFPPSPVVVGSQQIAAVVDPRLVEAASPLMNLSLQPLMGENILGRYADEVPDKKTWTRLGELGREQFQMGKMPHLELQLQNPDVEAKVFVHEFGHYMQDQWLNDRRPDSQYIERGISATKLPELMQDRKAAFAEYKKQELAAWKEFKLAHPPPAGTSLALQKSFRDEHSWVWAPEIKGEKVISNYALSNEHEYVAEAFQNYVQGGTNADHVKNVAPNTYALMDKLTKGYYFG